MVAQERQLPESRVDWTTKSREFKPLSIPHTRGNNTFRFSLDMSLQQLPGAEMLFWYPDRSFRKSVTYTVDFERKTKQCTPDSFWGARYREHRFGGLVEFDNSTMAGTTKSEESRIYDKLEALWHLWLKWQEWEYADRLGVDSLRLFYITKSEQRKENIRELARAVGDQKNGSEFFWFARQKSYQDNPFAVLDAIWQTPRDDMYKSMFGHSAGLSSPLIQNGPDDFDPLPFFSPVPHAPSPSLTRPLVREEIR
jgi:hypothetical protein